jgi:tripartite-type tricarboxylate transporter receptor subunit TctC
MPSARWQSSRLQRETARIMQTSEMQELLTKIGREAVLVTPQEFTERQRKARAGYGEIMKVAGIRAE